MHVEFLGRVKARVGGDDEIYILNRARNLERGVVWCETAAKN